MGTQLTCLAALCLLCACDSRTVPAADAALPGADAIRADGPVGDAGLLSEEAARACVIVSSCMAGLKVDNHQLPTPGQCLDWFAYRDWPRMSYTMDHAQEPLRRVLRCTKKFTTCQALFTCYGGNWIGPSLCREGGSCMANRLVTMQNNVYMLDCPAYKAKCMNLPTGAIRGCCVAKSCGGTAATTCKGALGSHCMLGVSFDFDCAPTGRLCTTAPGALCVGTGAKCPPGSKPKCAGTRATWCAAGRLSTYDCARNPFRSACDDNTLSMPCKPGDSQCAPSWVGRCDGKRVMFCQNGTKESLDCAKLGFSGCRVTDTRKVAHCH